MVDFRLPSITGSETEQLSQIRSFLYQFIPKLQWAMSQLNTTAGSAYVVKKENKAAEQKESFNAEVAFGALKPLIIKSADIVQAYYEEISSRIVGSYVAESDFGAFVEKTEQEIVQSSTDIEQIFHDMQGILTDIEALNFTLAEGNAHGTHIL